MQHALCIIFYAPRHSICISIPIPSRKKRNTKNDLHHAFPPKLLVTSFEPWNLEPLTFFCAKSIVRFLVRALNGYHQTICTQKWEYNLRVRKLPQSFIFLRCRSFSNKPIVHSPLLYYVLHLRTATHSRTHKLWQRVYQGLHPMIHNWIMSANVWAKPAIAAGWRSPRYVTRDITGHYHSWH